MWATKTTTCPTSISTTRSRSTRPAPSFQARTCSRSCKPARRPATTHLTASRATTHWKQRWRKTTSTASISTPAIHGQSVIANSLGYFGSYGDEEGAGESQTQATQNFFQNEYDPKGDYGRCTIDTAQDFGAFGVYNLPFGRGKQFANNVNRGVDAVIGGWQVAADLTLRSGFGITPFAGAYMGDQNANSASTLTGSYEPRPDCVAGQLSSQSLQTVQIGGSIGKTNLNPASVSEVADVADGGTFGNCQTGALRGPSLKTADLNVTKRIPGHGTRQHGAVGAVHQPDQHADLQRTGKLVGPVQLMRSLQRCSHHRLLRGRRGYGRAIRLVGWVEPRTRSRALTEAELLASTASVQWKPLSGFHWRRSALSH